MQITLTDIQWQEEMNNLDGDHIAFNATIVRIYLEQVQNMMQLIQLH